jgi:putative transposase
MGPLICRRHRFPREIIRHAIWRYLRFTLSYRDVEELLAKRGLEISYETVRRWVLKFGPIIAGRLRQRRSPPNNRWHLDEMVVRIAGERVYLWRALDDEGEVLNMLVQRRRDTRSALRLMRKLLKKQGFVRKILVTDKALSQRHDSWPDAGFNACWRDEAAPTTERGRARRRPLHKRGGTYPPMTSLSFFASSSR